jgi:hypothetical protein
MVWPVISYGASIWGTKSYSCINAVQNRAMRFYLGLGKYTPTAALYGELAWQPPHVKQWVSVARLWHRYHKMNRDRLNYKVYAYCYSRASTRCKNWQFNFVEHLKLINLSHILDTCNVLSSRKFCDMVGQNSMNLFINEWKQRISSPTGSVGSTRNKLRTYQLFKCQYETEKYVYLPMPKKHRSALAKFRCGVAPLRLETGRYENLDVNNRICPICKQNVETEIHVLTQCPAYQLLRNVLFDKAKDINADFINMNDEQKSMFVLSNPEIAKLTAKTCYNILLSRFDTLYH